MLIDVSHIYESNLTQNQVIEGLKRIRKFQEIHDKHREMKALHQQLDLKIKIDDVEQVQEEVTNIKNNLFSIFSVMIGFLGFIFINFNVFNSIGELSLVKLITVVIFLNMSFISGVVILMTMFKIIIFKDSTSNKSILLFLGLYLVINVILIIFLLSFSMLKNYIFTKCLEIVF